MFGKPGILLACWLFVMPLGVSQSSEIASAGKNCLVVCPPAFREAISPWEQHRLAEGFRLTFVSSASTTQEVIEQLDLAGRNRETDFILLVGDCRISASDAANAEREVPTFYRKPGPTARFGTTASLAGDAPYGDLDGDGVPEISVGRLPASTPEQLSAICQRIIAYETSSDFGPWRDTVQITAGVGGFGWLADSAIESATRSILTTAIPGQIRLGVTYASPNSPFNPGASDFFPTVLRRYREGGLFWVYMGHGQVTELDHVPGPGGTLRPVLASDDVHLLERPANSAPIALVFACYTGAFDANVDSLAERMLFANGGPIAVIAGSRVTMPYGNAIAAQGLIEACYSDRTERLGDAWLRAQHELATPTDSNPIVAERRKLLDMVAAAVSPSADLLPEERLEHIHLYNLLGDPTLKLQHADAITLEVPRGVAPGTTMLVRGNASQGGELTLSICYVPGGAASDVGKSALQQYEQANCVDVARVVLPQCIAGPFETTIEIPANVNGPMRVVARMQRADGWCAGSTTVLVRPE